MCDDDDFQCLRTNLNIALENWIFLASENPKPNPYRSLSFLFLFFFFGRKLIYNIYMQTAANVEFVFLFVLLFTTGSALPIPTNTKLMLGIWMYNARQSCTKSIHKNYFSEQ